VGLDQAMTRPELVARIADLERRLRRAQKKAYLQHKRAELWRQRALGNHRKETG